MDPKQFFHSTKSSEWENELTEALSLAKPIAEKITERTEKAILLYSSSRIYKVPEYLRKLKPSAYIPRFIAIGPFHRNDEHLQTPMQRIKMLYTNFLFDRVANAKGIEDKRNTGKTKVEVLLKCVATMKECVNQAKRYYAEEVPLVDKAKKHDPEEADNSEMVEMMLVDGCFILELLYSSYCMHIKSKEQKPASGGDGGNSKALSSFPEPNGGEGSSDHEQLSDPILDSVLNSNIVKQDLLLLENQIPFFVLEELFKLTVAKIPDGNELSLTDYVFWYFGDILGPEGTNSEGENSGSKTKTRCPLPSDCVLWVCDSTKESKPGKKEPGKANHYWHILHLLHERYPPPINKGEKKFTEFEVSASDLQYAGVKFVSRKGNNLFDITFKQPKGLCWWFHRAKFEIPTFNIYDATETLLRNLIALEQCFPGVRPHFTSYANFMDTLIDSKEDVKVLKKAKVIRNHLGVDDDIAELFNKLCKEVVVRDDYFNDKYQDAYNYSMHWCPNLMAHCKRKYFSSPWAFGAVIVAIIASGMGVTQFVRSFLT